LVVGQFETADLAEDLLDVVRPLDVAFIGSLDLSIAAGHPGEPRAREVVDLVARVVDAAHRAHRHVGMFAATAQEAREAMEAGCRYIAVSADLSLLRRASTDLVTELRTS
jgi:2-keto-3-deoxy-L-rhamnonate aldolase RhmA